MKKILGLDIGTNSIGWAIVETTDNKQEVSTSESCINNQRISIHKDAMGVRIIPQEEEHKRFLEGKTLNDAKGSARTKTANRRKYRGSRRMKSRYKLRRDKLLSVLEVLAMKPDGAYFQKDNSQEGTWYTKSKSYFTNERGQQQRMKRESGDLGRKLYELRDRAIREKISLPEWGRILLHLNQWRGYSSDRFKKEEKQVLDYFTGQILELNETPLRSEYEDKEKTILKWHQYAISIHPDEPIKVDDESTVTIMDGYIFTPKLSIKKDDIITFKFEMKEKKEKKIVIGRYFKINLTQPDPEDWNYKYQTLNKNLTEWCKQGGTVGSYFHHNFYEEKNIARIRTNVVNRDWYEDEFEKIWAMQYPFHKEQLEKFSMEEILSKAFKDDNIKAEVKKKMTFEEQLKFLIKEKIIYFQRPWQQSKSKGQCRFEKILVEKHRINQQTKQREEFEEYEGRTVIPRSHPLHQEFKIWQQINNVRLWCIDDGAKNELFSDTKLCKKKTGKEINEVKQLLYDELQKKKSLSWKSFVKETLSLDNVLVEEKSEAQPGKGKKVFPTNATYFTVNFTKRNRKGELKDIPLKGNTTKVALQSVLGKDEDWFNALHVHPNDKQKDSCKARVPNLQLLWEIIYDITNTNEKKVAALIKKHFGLDDQICEALSKIKFDDTGMGNLSAKAIRKLLSLMRVDNSPLPQKIKSRVASILKLNKCERDRPDEEKLSSFNNLISDKNARFMLLKLNSESEFKGLNYWQAAAIVYGQHSKQGIQSSAIEGKSIEELIEPVKRNSMNNPVVKRIVNETLSIVKEIWKRYDGFDEVRIELSRELKASREEREQMWEGMQHNETRNELAKAMLREMQKGTGISNIDKVKIYEDVVKQLHAGEYKEKEKEYKLGDPSKADVKRYLLWLDQKYQCPYTGEMIKFAEVFSYKYEIDHIIPRERYFDNSYSNKVVTRRAVNGFKGNLTAYELIHDHHDAEINDGNVTLKIKSWDAYQSHIENLFPRGRKKMNLLRKEIPEDPIARQLKETQFINTKLKEELGKVVGSDRVWTTTGSVTDMLRGSWHLNDVMKELVRNRFEKLKDDDGKRIHDVVIPERVDKETGEVFSEILPNYSKRLDHRHHALDALIIACTRQQHIQYINTLNAQYSASQDSNEEKKSKYQAIRQELCVGDGKNKFKTPWNEDDFIPKVKSAMENLVVSQKNAKVLISPSKHRVKKKIKPQKIASIRGELHLETNYAQRNYIEAQTASIENVIKRILTEKKDNQNQHRVFPKNFDAIIKQIVFKEKYQEILLSFFIELENEKLPEKINGLSKNILSKIQDSKSELSIVQWLSVFSESKIAARPFGTAMNFNNTKQVGKIADPRIKRLAELRLQYIGEKKEKLSKNTLIEKEQRDKLIKNLNVLSLYSNAVYEVRIKTGEKTFNWVFLPEITKDQIEKIEYSDKVKTKKVKEAIAERLNEFSGSTSLAFGSIFENPIFISKEKIPVKKVRQMGYFQKGLYEITPKRFVQSNDSFMLYMFQHKESKKRDWKILKFLDAVRLIDHTKPDKIIFKNLYTHEESENFQLLFTLQKNDSVYLPQNEIVDVGQIDFNDSAALSNDLYVVKDINPSQNLVFFQRHTIADSIQLKKEDVAHLLPALETKNISEEIKSGAVDKLNLCIKLFSDKLGKTIVPYWKFPDGCWDNEVAKQLGLA